MIRQIAPQFFTTDLSATLAYYRDKLGFACVSTWQDPPVYAIVTRDEHRIHFRCAEPPAANPEKYDDELLDAYFFIDEAEGLYAEYAARGVEFTRTLGDTPWHSREFVVKDCDGRLLAFGASRDQERRGHAEHIVAIETRMANSGDHAIFDNVAPGVFDNACDPLLVAEFLADARHHLAVAIDGGQIVGFASGVHYVHPDKPSDMWINEVGVAPGHQGRGLGKGILETLVQHAKHLGCREAWVLTDRANSRAMRLYASIGGEEAPGEQVMFTFFLNRSDSAR